jgi:hypothetical protein
VEIDDRVRTLSALRSEIRAYRARMAARLEELR